MTLHWWMHWFWVTAQIVVTLTGPTTSDQRTTESVAVTETSTTTTTTATTTTTSLPDKADSLAKLQQSYRIAKAIGIQPPMNVATVSQNFDQPSVTTDSSRSFQFSRYGSTVSSGFDRLRSSPSPPVNRTAFEVFENKTSQPGRIPGKKEAKITWVQAFSKPQKAKYEEKSSTPSSLSLLTSSTPSVNDSGNEPTSEETLTVMPLQRQDDKSIDPNSISRSKPLLVATNRSITEELLLGRETVEPHAIATAASILDAAVGLGDSTRLGRARGTFTSEFHLDQLSREERPRSAVGKGKEEAPINETAPETSSANVTEIATITGSCLAIIILLSTVGSLGFIMYRRRYLNPPQTLNSDKCSNPDSSGYIDDSTIRDNSEEMYSLDNDSFLNSLEAMTIQNYWTDSVKHTKL